MHRVLELELRANGGRRPLDRLEVPLLGVVALVAQIGPGEEPSRLSLGDTLVTPRAQGEQARVLFMKEGAILLSPERAGRAHDR
jgi:hypothetical protein